MEKLLNQYDKDCMKMAMLKHEETFREQVYELHRLYQIQKLLMKNISKRNVTSASNKIKINHHDQDIYKRSRQCLDLDRPEEGCRRLEIEDESELVELTLGPTSQSRRKKTSDNSAGSFSSSTTTTGSSYLKKGSFGNYHQTREELMGMKWSLDTPSSSVPPGFLGGRKNSSDVEEQFRQDRRSNNNPPWLFHALSLNTS